jgi:hypothetical protein
MNRMAVTPDRAPLARLVKRIMLHSGSGHCHVAHGRLLVGWRETTVEQPKPARMNRDEFRRWVEEQGGRRFERVAGEPVAMSPERLGHVRLKYRVWQALDAALAEGGLGCEAIGDGATVEINEDVDYEPDVLVECGDRTSNDALPPQARRSSSRCCPGARGEWTPARSSGTTSRSRASCTT